LFVILFYLFVFWSLSLDATDFENLQEHEDQDFEQQLKGNPGK
jgi:hypothetical protein